MEPHISSVSQPSSTNDQTLPERFNRLKEKVLVKRPVLQSILTKKGSKPLLEYANEFVDVNLNPPILSRQSELLDTIHEATEERFGNAIADSVVRQLEHYYFVSTADHTGPITHPFFVNSNLLTAASMLTHSDPVLQNIIVLSCANISLGNSSCPRGILFHTYKDNELKEHRLSFLPSNSHSSSVYTFRAYTADEILKIKKLLKEKVRDGEVPAIIGAKIEGLIDDVYAQPDILACSSYCEQVGKTNVHLWEKFFEKSNVKMPRLVYLEQEDIVVRLIIKHHLHEDTVINHILFDSKYEPFLNNYFEGIFGSFSRANSSGTYLFWARPAGSKLNLQLWRKGNELVSEDGSYRVALTPEAIKAGMESRELIPSLLLNFVTISFYYGLKCLGGFNQVNYLTLMKNAYIRMNVDLENYRSIEVCARAQTKEICDGMTMAFLGYGENKLALATGIDLILYGDSDSWSNMIDICKNITLEEALDPLMPEIYPISYDQSEWEEDLKSITEQDVNRLKGLDKKLHPCIKIA